MKVYVCYLKRGEIRGFSGSTGIIDIVKSVKTRKQAEEWKTSYNKKPNNPWWFAEYAEMEVEAP